MANPRAAMAPSAAMSTRLHDADAGQPYQHRPVGRVSKDRGQRRRLPPLNALRAFEAVARSLSFTRAADQLLVTQSAVSRQVKNLEDIMGVQLLKRKGQLELTEEGRKLLPVLTASFDRIAETIGGIKENSVNPPLTLALPPTFARRLVMPRMRDFQSRHPDLDIRIETPMSNVDFAGAPIDMAIFFGLARVDDLIADLLMREELTPVCSPGVAGEAGNDLALFLRRRTLLHVRQGDELWQDWSIFARAAGLGDFAVDRGLVLGTADLAVESAINDGGVAVVDVRLFAEEMRSGRLVAPFDATYPSQRSYFLGEPGRGDRDPAHRRLPLLDDRALRVGPHRRLDLEPIHSYPHPNLLTQAGEACFTSPTGEVARRKACG
jgi:LysR family glycine cleavage system transcriptional activator